MSQSRESDSESLSSENDTAERAGPDTTESKREQQGDAIGGALLQRKIARRVALRQAAAKEANPEARSATTATPVFSLEGNYGGGRLNKNDRIGTVQLGDAKAAIFLIGQGGARDPKQGYWWHGNKEGYERTRTSKVPTQMTLGFLLAGSGKSVQVAVITKGEDQPRVLVEEIRMEIEAQAGVVTAYIHDAVK